MRGEKLLNVRKRACRDKRKSTIQALGGFLFLKVIGKNLPTVGPPAPGSPPKTRFKQVHLRTWGNSGGQVSIVFG